MASLPELRAIVGDAHAADGDAPGGPAGGRSRFLVEPGSVEELSAVMSLAARAGWKVAPHGGGSKAGWGSAPAALDLVVGTSRLSRLLEHTAGDLVTSVQAGIRLDALQAELAREGQMLALDPPERGATIGGVIAANASGPRRFRYGTVRDLLIGITVVLADGTVAKAGGKVVKNVAGYDLAKLFTGSLGTLGVIAGATFRLHPLPATRGAVRLACDAPAAVGEAVARLLASTLVPTAVEVDAAPGAPPTLLVLFEGIAPGVDAQVAGAEALLRPLGSTVALAGDELATAWDALLPRPWGPGDVGLKVTHLPADLARVLSTVAELAARHGTPARSRGSAATGVLYVGTRPRDAEAAAALVSELRAAVREGSVVVHDAPPEQKARLDVWGPVPGIDLMRRVKHEFDPAGALNPGRFVGGI